MAGVQLGAGLPIGPRPTLLRHLSFQSQGRPEPLGEPRHERSTERGKVLHEIAERVQSLPKRVLIPSPHRNHLPVEVIGAGLDVGLQDRPGRPEAESLGVAVAF
jgi:hypothetical protein